MQHIYEAEHLAALPVHPLPQLTDLDDWQLRISGAARSIALDLVAVKRLLQTCVVEPFTCLEGWTAGPLHWRGVLLATLLGLLETHGAFVAVSAGDFCTVMALKSLPAETLLADSLNGKDLPREHGGPFRLIVPGGICYQSVKWVQRIDVRDSDVGDTARAIALARLTAHANG